MEGVSVEVAADPRATAAGVALATLLGALAGAIPAWGAARREIVQGFRTA
jgi:ABC-type antimicrobial peptide transport system permease subunit